MSLKIKPNFCDDNIDQMSKTTVMPVEETKEQNTNAPLFRNQKKARRVSCSIDLMKNGKRQCMFTDDEWPDDNKDATKKECGRLPVDDNGQPITVTVSMLVKKIRSVDAIQSW